MLVNVCISAEITGCIGTKLRLNQLHLPGGLHSQCIGLPSLYAFQTRLALWYA